MICCGVTVYWRDYMLAQIFVIKCTQCSSQGAIYSSMEFVSVFHLKYYPEMSASNHIRTFGCYLARVPCDLIIVLTTFEVNLFSSFHERQSQIRSD